MIKCSHITLLIVMFMSAISIHAQYVVDTTIGQCGGVTLTASGAERYVWSPGERVSDSMAATVVAHPKRNTVYRADGFNAIENIVMNGDFEHGNVNFTSDYQYSDTSIYQPATYAVGTNAHNYHNLFVSTGDHTSGVGNYMIVNGSTTPNAVVWGQNLNLTDSTYYEISFWIANMMTVNPARLQIIINGNAVGPVITTEGNGQWTQYRVIWYNDTIQNAEVALVNQNNVTGGNDFGIDDISFTSLQYQQTQLFRTILIADTEYAYVCSRYMWPRSGLTYYEEGIHEYNRTYGGCDSLYRLNLTLHINSYFDDIDSACGEYVWPMNRQTYTQTGIYSDSVPNREGCYNVGVLNLKILNCSVVDYPDNVDNRRCTFIQDSTSWSIRNSWSSGGGVSNHNTPMVGDLDNDGTPDIMCFGSRGETDNNGLIDRTLLVYDGVTKALKANIWMPCYVTAYDAGAYGLVKLPSRKGLIVVAGTDHYLYAFDITAADPSTPYWVSDQPYGSNNQYAVNLFFADFNNDGNPEIAVRDKIYDAATGVLLATATGGSCKGASYAHYSHRTGRTLYSPIAANILGDDRQELILGNEIYDVQITNNRGTAGNSVTLLRRINPPSGVPNDGHAQVADFNLDGHLDILITNKNIAGGGGFVSMYVWDVGNNRVGEPYMIPCNMSGKSIPLVCDMDGDSQLEVTIQCAATSLWGNRVGTFKVLASNLNFQLMWAFPVDEDSYSNGMTAFDFNLDGRNEMLICDQSRIRVVDGAGNTLNTFSFSETTIMQYPVIADVDNDGHAEIVSVGSGRLNVFSSSGQPWAPARSVWNQYVYNTTCVNNDLTIPELYYNNSTPLYDPDGVTIRRPFNNCLQQATQIDNYGRPYYTAVDLNHDSTIITLTIDSVVINSFFSNNGSRAIFAPYYITIYADSIGGMILLSKRFDDTVLRDSRTTSHLALPISMLCHLDADKFFIVLNDAGSGPGQEGGQPTECNLDNNIFLLPIPDIKPIGDTLHTHACNTFTWTRSHQGITRTNTFDSSIFMVDTILDHNGCDSLRSLDLRVTYSFADTTTETVCDTYTWHVNNTTYTTSQHIVDSMLDIDGCDSIWQLFLTVNYSYLFRVHDTVADTLLPHYFIDREYNYPIRNDKFHYTTINNCDSDYYYNLVIDYHRASCDGLLQFPSLVTPNGDGVNDIFEIGNLLFQDCYPSNELYIYNRWGKCVYSVINIHKTEEFWNPINIPSGTYYYHFRGHGLINQVERSGVVEVINK